MQQGTSAKIEIPASLLSIYQEIAVSPVDLLKNHALNIIRGKIAKYEAEDLGFKEKHGCGFEAFKAQVDSMVDEENFEWEDDLMDWEFAVANLKLWREKEGMIDYR